MPVSLIAGCNNKSKYKMKSPITKSVVMIKGISVASPSLNPRRPRVSLLYHIIIIVYSRFNLN